MNILELKNNFNDIKNIRESSINLMKSLGDKIETLKIIYNELNIETTLTPMKWSCEQILTFLIHPINQNKLQMMYQLIFIKVLTQK